MPIYSNRSGPKGPDRFVSGNVTLHPDKTCVRTDGPAPRFGPAHRPGPQNKSEDLLRTIFRPVSLAIVRQAGLEQD